MALTVFHSCSGYKLPSYNSVPCGVCSFSRRAWGTILIEALQEKKSTLSAVGYPIDDGS